MPGPLADWKPRVEQRTHPFGEAGVRSSLEETAKRAAQQVAHMTGNGEHLARVRTWSVKKIHAAKMAGRRVDSDRARAEAILTAIQREKVWVPDPVATEYIPGAHLMACDVDSDNPEGVCVQGDDCDGCVTLCAACFLSVGLHTMIVGHGYDRGHPRDRRLQHVICVVQFDGRWHYADPSYDFPLGKCHPFTRERIIAIPNMKVVCDSESCFVNGQLGDFDPEDAYVELGGGLFVGVDGGPKPRIVWIGAEPDLTGPECSNVPDGLDEETLKTYASRCGKEVAAKWVEDQTGVSIGKCAQGSAESMPECVANNYGVTLEVYKDGEIQWDAVAQDAGAVGAIVVCAATGLGAAAAPLCGKVGGKIGQIVYKMASGVVEFAEGFGETIGLWDDKVKYIACAKVPPGTITSDEASAAIGHFIQHGYAAVTVTTEAPDAPGKLDPLVEGAYEPAAVKRYWGRVLAISGMAMASASVVEAVARAAGVSGAVALEAVAGGRTGAGPHLLGAPGYWHELAFSKYSQDAMNAGGFLRSLMSDGWKNPATIVPAWRKFEFWAGAQFATSYVWRSFVATYVCDGDSGQMRATTSWVQDGPTKQPTMSELKNALSGGDPGNTIVRTYSMPESIDKLARSSVVTDEAFKASIQKWRVFLETDFEGKVARARKIAAERSPSSGNGGKVAAAAGIAAAVAWAFGWI